jgi:hypothetical protein
MEDKLMWMVGFNFVLHSIEKTRAALAPQAHVQYALLNNNLLPYLSMNGFGVRQSTFMRASQTNLFVRSDLDLRNEINQINIKGGFRGSITQRISFDANFSWGVFEDKMLFVLDTSLARLNQFKTEFTNMNISTLEAAFTYQAKERLKFDLVGQLFSYRTRTIPVAWNLPDYVIRFRGHYNMFDKFITSLDFGLMGGRKMKEFGPGDGITVEDNYFYSDMGLLADLNVSFEYRYNKRFSAFLELNNVAAQQYLRWYNYPVYGFQIMGGATFRF